MKSMRAVESDSVKSARKAKNKLHRACERASEICERTLHRRAHDKHESHKTVIDSSQHTSTITCTATPRVWHFGAFHIHGVFILCGCLLSSNLVPRPHPLTRRNSLVNQVEFLGLSAHFCNNVT